MTREAQRFAWLVEQLREIGISQSEFARLTRMETSYVNKLANPETSGKGAIGADIVRKVKDGLKVSPDYFYDDYEGQRDHRLYMLSAKRDEKRVSAIESTSAQHELTIAHLQAEIATMRAELLQIRQDFSRPPATTQKRR